MWKFGLQAATMAVLLVPTSAMAAETPPKDYRGSYLCKMTASAGIKFDEASQKWNSVLFDVKDMIYIVKVTPHYEFKDGIAHAEPVGGFDNITVRELEGKRDALLCLSDNAVDRLKVSITSGYTSCASSSWKYWFNFETMKIQSDFTGGYMGTELDTDTPAVSVGTCQRID